MLIPRFKKPLYHFRISTKVWLAIALIIFIQLAFAEHSHAAEDEHGPGCLVCIQLDTAEHATLVSGEWLLFAGISTSVIVANTGIVPASSLLIPPSRAPPVFSSQ